MIHLPDDTPATLLHPDGHWTGTLGDLRRELGGEEKPQPSDSRRRTIEMWVRIGTEHYTGPYCWLTPGDGAPERKA